MTNLVVVYVHSVFQAAPLQACLQRVRPKNISVTIRLTPSEVTLSRHWAPVDSSHCWRTALSAVPKPGWEVGLLLFSPFSISKTSNSHIFQVFKTIPPASALPPPRHRPSWPILSSSLCNSISVQVMMALISMETLIRDPWLTEGSWDHLTFGI